ncbi:MAG: acylphosphatase [Candidatus Diapherotrites archaeon]|nr:acylphosphatase [Candidatus Diapherotrites archaeon]
MKARILVYGNVQGVGFRAYARQTARNMQISGLVRNLPGGNVEIYCKARKPAIEKFAEKIDVKEGREDPLSLHVEKTAVFFENQKGYSEPEFWPDFFEVDYGAEKNFSGEMLERTEIASRILNSMNKTLKGVDAKTELTNQKLEKLNMLDELAAKADATNSKLDKLGGLISKADMTNSKLDGLICKADSTNSKLDKLDRIDRNIEELKDDTKTNFNRLDRTYGKISAEMKQIGRSITTNSKSSQAKTSNALSTLNKNTNANFKTLNKTLAKLIKVAVLHQINKIY